MKGHEQPPDSPKKEKKEKKKDSRAEIRPNLLKERKRD